MDQGTLKHYLADDPPSVVPLAIAPHFNALSQQEKLYAHYISIASFAGTRVVLRQVSPESEPVYDLIIALHQRCKGDWSSLQRQANISADDLKHFLSYAAQFLGNCGNFKSFGDVKFLPRIPVSQFKALASTDPRAAELFAKAEKGIYAGSNTAELHLGYPDAGHVSAYYPASPDITKEEIAAVSDFFEEKRLLPENTRLRKTTDGNFELLIASAQQHPSKDAMDVSEIKYQLTGKFSGKTATLIYGDHAVEMEKIANALKQAGKNAANEFETKMMAEYVKSFSTGSLQAFLDSQRFWIKDKGPTVECNIGFIETYRDCHGIRGEWEGFAAMVNKERTKAFTRLVEAAPEQIPKLPWKKEFEKDKFLAPDFTSLEVLTFAGSGIPAGINIPNSDAIRQTEGFKNVSLGNILSAKAPNEKIPFIKDADLALYRANSDAAFEVQVGLHELLGHGCGKLLQETSSGQYNFDVKNPPISPITEKPITTWYKPGQTWNSVFGSLGSAYEECRAECVAMALICDSGVLKMFGHDGTEAEDVMYVGYLWMARAGIAALEYWDPKSKKWGQPHMQARYSILRTLLDAGNDFCSLDHSQPDMMDLTIKIDRTKIVSRGRPAVEKYLQKLQVYKATADYAAGSSMFEAITSVDETLATKVRPVVLAKKQPRKVFVQANTVLGDDGNVLLKEYASSPEGMIQSFAERLYV